MRELQPSEASISELLSLWHPCCVTELSEGPGVMSGGPGLGKPGCHRVSFHSHLDHQHTLDNGIPVQPPSFPLVDYPDPKKAPRNMSNKSNKFGPTKYKVLCWALQKSNRMFENDSDPV